MNDVILKMALLFLERQVIKFGQSLDWEKVKADIKTRIEDIVPGVYFDSTAVLIVNAMIDLVANFFATQNAPITAANLPQAVASAQNGLVRELAARAAKAV